MLKSVQRLSLDVGQWRWRPGERAGGGCGWGHERPTRSPGPGQLIASYPPPPPVLTQSNVDTAEGSTMNLVQRQEHLHSQRVRWLCLSVYYIMHSTAVCTVQIKKIFFHSVSTSIKVKIIYRFVIFSTTTFHKCFIDDWTSNEEYLDELVFFSLLSD